jgi:hypothetical protein
VVRGRGARRHFFIVENAPDRVPELMDLYLHAANENEVRRLFRSRIFLQHQVAGIAEREDTGEFRHFFGLEVVGQGAGAAKNSKVSSGFMAAGLQAREACVR